MLLILMSGVVTHLFSVFSSLKQYKENHLPFSWPALAVQVVIFLGIGFRALFVTCAVSSISPLLVGIGKIWGMT